MNFFNLHQSHHFHSQRGDIRDVSRQARESKNEIEDLHARLDRLHLATSAMWELLCERTGLDEDDLLAKIQEVDLRDGRLDGRVDEGVNAPPAQCPACSRVNNSRRTTCLYCGIELPPTSPI